MSPEPQKPKLQIKAEPENCIIVNQPDRAEFLDGRRAWPRAHSDRGRPEARDHQVAGLPSGQVQADRQAASGDAGGDAAAAHRQGACTPRAWYSPNMLYCKILGSPHPRASVKSMDTSEAEKMPGVAYILTSENGPKPYPMTDEPRIPGRSGRHRRRGNRRSGRRCGRGHPGRVRSSSVRLQPATGHGAESRRTLAPRGRGNVVKSAFHWGDVEKGIYAIRCRQGIHVLSLAGAIPVPIAADRLRGQVGRRQADGLGHGSGHCSVRIDLAKQLGIPVENVRYINKWNGGTFGGADAAAPKFYPWIAHISKMTNRPVKIT